MDGNAQNGTGPKERIDEDGGDLEELDDETSFLL
jgi:hypothetical protein